MFYESFRSRRVLVTGHTGFKGAWLCEWLLQLGSRVTGFSLPGSVTEPSLFDQLGLAARLDDRRGDIRDAEAVRSVVADTQPDFVFHLAAQPLVRLSYKEPAATWQANVLGTIHVLEALRQLSKPCVAVLITTDKVYENREWDYAYRECDPLGGYDPYSSSKAAAEIAIASWGRSFFPKTHPVRIASARAGNVIGGGDWALDRIVPDAIRALSRNEPIPVRNPRSTRPWQHVLEPLSGYLRLAVELSHSDFGGSAAGGHDPAPPAFNFGPSLDSNRPVSALVEEMLRHWPGRWEDRSDPNAPHEAGKLNLATDKAFHLLGWRPRWDFATTIRKTTEWYRAVHDGGDPIEITRRQIREYSESN